MGGQMGNKQMYADGILKYIDIDNESWELKFNLKNL